MLQIIDTFIRQLTEFPPLDHIFNQYAYHQDPAVDHANAVRRHNLSLYLGLMMDRKPNALWIGEAPGYRGYRITGIPFTSEFILVHGEGSLLEDTNALTNRGPDLFGLSRGFKHTPEKLESENERTATMIWKKVSHLKSYPLLWNAFPLHPHPPDEENKNRPPRKDEINLGYPLILKLLEIYDFKKIAAIGRVAERCLDELNLQSIYIRHPSHAGKGAFLQGVDDFTDYLN